MKERIESAIGEIAAGVVGGAVKGNVSEIDGGRFAVITGTGSETEKGAALEEFTRAVVLLLATIGDLILRGRVVAVIPVLGPPRDRVLATAGHLNHSLVRLGGP